MKAVVYTRYGSPDVLRLTELPRPTPGDNQVLIRVHATSVNAADVHYLRGEPLLFRPVFGFPNPRQPILGVDVAGRVEQVGRSVQRFHPGDDVFGCMSPRGAFAEYVCAPEDLLASKPPRITFDEAAAVPLAAITALQGLRDIGHIQPGQRVLINGASGGVGTFAVQIAKAFGADVTGVCSPTKVDLVRAVGAHHVIDYTREDFTKTGRQYDLILAANGYHPIFDYRRALSPRGTYVASGGSIGQLFEAMLLGPWISMTGGKKMRNLPAMRPNGPDLAFVKDLLESGKIAPVIDRCYPLSDVPEALRYLEAGHARGKVVITLKTSVTVSESQESNATPRTQPTA